MFTKARLVSTAPIIMGASFFLFSNLIEIITGMEYLLDLRPFFNSIDSALSDRKSAELFHLNEMIESFKIKNTIYELQY